MADEHTLQSRLEPLRQRIDALDTQILDLLNQRARAALEVGEVKKAFDAAGPILKPEREALIIRRLQSDNPGPVPDEAVAAIWRQIISTCRGLESVLTAAFLGPQGSFSEQAAYEHFGHAITGLRCESFDEVFRAVEAGQADVGIVPVENSSEGAVNRSLDLLLNSSLKVLGERTIRIHHNLLTRTGGLEGVTRVLGHPQALAQCQAWLSRNHPELERLPVASNAQAARMASEDPTCAAIAGDAAAAAWGLSAVVSGIQDDPQNQTRFVAVGPRDAGPTGRDKTSLVLAVPNRAGAVYDMLAPLSRHGVSMTRFESRPARTGQWEYYFYVDLLGHREDEPVAQALAELRQQVAFFKVLGSYPRQ
ncbi:prephenate dehydratase [Castellaniella defragrans]|uniref:Bifunctional chorismate mutase/prephenate dehydratase n=2 Tax=Castellaniella defragrans TaxID=75697 RepID=W8WWF8_CASD6|nr:prephenate dehydratase [Castellaniella defragrans]KAB0610499.1 prephenate dehydratase [Castellaniella defragrans]MBB6082847.1 chorismate mutase/prephenate dehydratase [Castellaniella defragrans]CDM23899.1 Chorismate mutase I / Prephenate dehydratase [Castellaniella defragrans 65Phen]